MVHSRYFSSAVDGSGEFKRWLVQVAKGLAVVPAYCSPEYHTALTERRIQRAAVYVDSLSPHKNDVFCLGLVLLQLATLQNVAVGFITALVHLTTVVSVGVLSTC